VEFYHFNLIDAGGDILSEKVESCIDDWQAEATARILILSRGAQAVEAWSEGRLLYRVERS
jgi:hypothetical protein